MVKLICAALLLCASFAGSAQKYNHFLIHWEVGNTDYFGILVMDRKQPRQVLRVLFVDNDGNYRLVQEKFNTRHNGNTYYLKNVSTTNSTPCWGEVSYSPDQFYFVGEYGLDLYLQDEQGLGSIVEEEFLDYRTLDALKPLFWPESYYLSCSEWLEIVESFFDQ